MEGSEKHKGSLEALSGKIKSVLSSFPQWDLQPSSVSRPRGESDFEDPSKRPEFIPVRETAAVQPSVIVPVGDISDDESASSPSNPSSSDAETDDPLRKLPASKPTPKETSSAAIDPLLNQGGNTHKQPPFPPIAAVIPSIAEEKKQEADAQTSLSAAKPLYDIPQPIFQEPVLSKAPILGDRSEDASSARRAVAQEAAKKGAAEHREGKVCQGCELS